MSDTENTGRDPCGNKWNEGHNSAMEMMRPQMESIKSSLDTALRLLRDRKGIPHWDRELSQADMDVLAMVAKLGDG